MKQGKLIARGLLYQIMRLPVKFSKVITLILGFKAKTEKKKQQGRRRYHTGKLSLNIVCPKIYIQVHICFTQFSWKNKPERQH
jgi:hypothetical protein